MLRASPALSRRTTDRVGAPPPAGAACYAATQRPRVPTACSHTAEQHPHVGSRLDWTPAGLGWWGPLMACNSLPVEPPSAPPPPPHPTPPRQPSSLPPAAVKPYERPPSHGLQYFSAVPGEDVVGQPYRHMAADKQASQAGGRLHRSASAALAAAAAIAALSEQNSSWPPLGAVLMAWVLPSCTSGPSALPLQCAARSLEPASKQRQARLAKALGAALAALTFPELVPCPCRYLAGTAGQRRRPVRGRHPAAGRLPALRPGALLQAARAHHAPGHRRRGRHARRARRLHRWA